MTNASLASWLERFGEAEVCPWPGPRPLRSKETLIGRDEDREQFKLDVNGNSLIVLSGASGVGKSSFLKAGLIPDLQEIGYTVAVCDDYSGGFQPGAPSGPAQFIAGKVAPAFAESPLLRDQPIPTDETLFSLLNNTFADRAVIVLDQFEELIRHAPTQKMGVFRFVVALHQSYKTKVIISLRDEFLHELRWIEHRSKSFSFARFILDDLDPEYAIDAVTSINLDDDARSIEPSAAETIAASWITATEETEMETIIDPFGRIGLLHLQAFLYCLDHYTTASTITEDDVSAVMARLGVGDHSTTEVFKSALIEAVDVKLERCRQAAYEVGLDEFLVEGAAGHLARSVGHLSSAGYKLVREVGDLFNATMGPDLDVLMLGTMRSAEQSMSAGMRDPAWDRFPEADRALPEHVQSLVHHVTGLVVAPSVGTDVLTISRTDLASKVGTEDGADWAERIQPGAPPWVADPNDVTCGPMSGLPAAAVLFEEARRFAFALAWLTSSDLVRLSTPSDDATMVSIIHDGFGRALQNWSDRRISSQQVAFTALTAAPGPSFVWNEPGQEVIGTEERPRILANLRWKGGFVIAHFRNVAMVNCDLRGTLFSNCTFEGVTLINCLLDGTILSDCTIIGHPDPDDSKQKSDGAPTFVVSTDDGYVDQIVRYREFRSKYIKDLFSPIPGAPAVPASSDDQGSLHYRHSPGGLTFYGGRLSALVIRGCDFDNGAMAVRYAAGSGLELVELTAANLEITGSALRHVTVTAPAVSHAPVPLDVDIDDSVLGQCWIGQETVGTIDVRNSRLIQVWNEGDALLTASEKSVLLHVPRAQVVDDSSELLPSDFTSLDEIDRRGDLLAATRSIDYRRNPAREQSALRGWESVTE